MGNITQPKYRIELSCVSFSNKRQEWHVYPYKGKPSVKSGTSFRKGLNASFAVGQPNEHLRRLQSDYINFKIINQRTNEVVIHIKEATFQLI